MGDTLGVWQPTEIMCDARVRVIDLLDWSSVTF
jgi:hypothetical protein